jgi:peptide/nickel transport system permease protein
VKAVKPGAEPAAKPAAGAGARAGATAVNSPGSRAWRAFFRNRLAIIGSVMLILILAAVIVGPMLVPRDLALRPAPRNMLQAPSSQHILGTDEVGRDVAARLLYAGRVSIPVSLSAMVVALLAASLIGITSGYFGGWLDTLFMRTADALLSIPTIFLLLTIAAVMRPNVTVLVLVIGLLSWMDLARIVRVQTIALSKREQIEGVRALGAKNWRILLRHVLPNVQGPLLVAAPLVAGRALLTESALSYLGLGIQAPTPTWGNMLNQAQQFALSTPLLAVAPGLAIMVTVIAINFIGDGLRDAFDPRRAG